jgi:dTDP-4-dehydrorhamnose reductase
MRVIVGAGKVATVIRKESDVVLSHSDIEIKDFNNVMNRLREFSGDDVTVINTVSKINLEWCETNKIEAYDVNVIGAINVAKVCKELDLRLVHVSSGCIFDGGETEKLYTEDDEPTPAAWYTKTKAEADSSIVRLNHRKTIIVRPRQLISKLPYPTNMITKFVSMTSGKFITSKNSLTCIEDMGDMIDHLISGEHYGIYNVANSGFMSPYDIALRVRSLNPALIVDSVNYEDYVKTLEVRRVNTLLDLSKLASTGYLPRNAESALNWCIQNYGS